MFILTNEKLEKNNGSCVSHLGNAIFELKGYCAKVVGTYMNIVRKMTRWLCVF